MKEIDGIMWRSVGGTFICLCFCYFLLPALTHEEMFGRKLPRAGKVLDGSTARPFVLSSSNIG